MTPHAHANAFPPTMWTVLLHARDPGSPEACAAREELCRAYWRPVHAWLCTLGLRADEAEDLTQRLLADLCHGEAMAGIDREKGRLRNFFKVAARHLLYSYRRDAAAQKRGGGSAALVLDDLPDADQPAEEAPAEAVFDRQWAWTIFDRAMRTLEQGYAQRRKGDLLEALKPSLISGEAVQQSPALCSQFGVKESQLRIELHRLRRRLAERLHSEVAATLGPGATPDEIAAETRYLLTVLAHEPAQ